ncbi:MAG: glucose 1-dehydrogenase [Gemmatimonadetes bacterium]|nr:glucose 1-dehydrogenase [Gemmatimonadota bacterium]
MTDAVRETSIPPVATLLDLTGRVALVTGAGRGIGASIAERFAEAGARVVVHYRSSEEPARAVVRRILARDGHAIELGADLTVESAVDGLFEAAADRLGPPDVLVNNAGVYPLSPLLEMPVSEWDAVIEANLKSVHLCTQRMARALTEAGLPGAIVNIASIEGMAPAPLHSHYTSAKAATLMHTRSAALELGPHGIRVNAVAPGLIRRPGLEEDWPEGVERWRAGAPLGRLGEASDVADACLFLASAASRWISGATVTVDGGILASPAF